MILDSGVTTDYLAPSALLPDGWATNVRFRVGPDGMLSGVDSGDADSGATVSGATLLSGPVIPGVPNVHSHAFQRAMVGLAESSSPGAVTDPTLTIRDSSGPMTDSFWSWRALMFAFLDLLGPEDVQIIAAQLYVEMLEAGYTSVAEFHYLHNQVGGARYDDPAEMGRRIVAAAAETGIGLTLLPTLYRRGGFSDEVLAPGQLRFVLDPDELIEMRDRLRSDAVDPIRIGLALHSLRAVSPTDLDQVVASVLNSDALAPIHIHIAEQVREVESSVSSCGATPVEWLFDHVDVDSRWTLIHATHTTPTELARIASSHAVVGLCPTTEANLGDGYFRLAEFLASGGVFAIGSDSHISVDPREELRWLEYHERLRGACRNVVMHPDSGSIGRGLLEHAYRGGAQSVARPVGRLAPGARADWVVLDPSHPTLVGRDRDQLLNGWVFAGNRSPILETWVGGHRLVEEGHHRHREEIAERFRRVIRKISRLL